MPDDIDFLSLLRDVTRCLEHDRALNGSITRLEASIERLEVKVEDLAATVNNFKGAWALIVIAIGALVSGIVSFFVGGAH